VLEEGQRLHLLWHGEEAEDCGALLEGGQSEEGGEELRAAALAVGGGQVAQASGELLADAFL
jgi:hypothetical protein